MTSESDSDRIIRFGVPRRSPASDSHVRTDVLTETIPRQTVSNGLVPKTASETEI